MAIHTELKSFDRIACEIGGSPALLLAAFFGQNGKGVYVPPRATPGHVLERLLGRESFKWLCEAFGGETLSVPSLEGLKHVRNAGMIHALSKCGVSTALMASACDVSQRRVQQIREQLTREGFADLLDDLDEHNQEGTERHGCTA